jgi:hypothetical protein
MSSNKIKDHLDANKFVDDFVFHTDENSMDKISGKEFIKRFKVRMAECNIRSELMEEWAKNFWEFTIDNPTCGIGAERERLLQEFLRNY